MKKRILLLGAMFIAIMIFVSCATSGSDNHDDHNHDNQTQQEIAAPEIQLNNLKGDQITLSDYKGKAVVINFLTTWCGYCKKELPYFVKMQQEYKDKDVVFLFVDVQENSADVKKFTNSMSIPEESVLLDQQGIAAATYAVRGFPYTYVIDKKGNVAVGFTGMVEESTLRNAVENVLK